MVNINNNLSPSSLGKNLNAVLNATPEYKKYYFVDWNQRSSTEIIKQTLESLYSKLKLTFNSLDGTITSDLNKAKFYTGNNVQPGDILVVNSSTPSIVAANFKYFCILSLDIQNQFDTFPLLSESEKNEIFSSSYVKDFTYVRPNLSALTDETISELNKISQNAISDLQADTIIGNRESFTGKSIHGLGDGALQIGDIIFLVEPTQLAFTTQNGYQTFETLRTQGNPKIPSMQQVKNLNISLIFPNEDSINNQLVPLFAMFRRTPFVNIKNKDICDFFKDITDNNGTYLPVALESINIQSVEGFPNTLQATITILPFDPNTISIGFKALLSIGDVAEQQQLMFSDKILEQQIRKSQIKMDESNLYPENYKSMFTSNINWSYNFRESLPFRAFYQSLIAERTLVLDEFGNVEPTVSKNTIINQSGFDLRSFRPTDSRNSLHFYNAESNTKEIRLKYKYIPQSSNTIARNISNERFERQDEEATQLATLYNLLATPEDLTSQVITMFVGVEDFFRSYEYRFSEMDNLVSTYLAQHNIDVQGEEGKAIKSLFDLLTQSIAHSLGLSQFVSSIKQVAQAPKAFSETIKQPNYQILEGLTWTGRSNDIALKSNETKTALVAANELCSTIWSNINSGNDVQKEQKKKQLTEFLFSIGLKLKGDMTSRIITTTNSADTPFDVRRLPIAEDIIIIDNHTNVMTGWSLTFNNKFTAINLQAYKYPFYQHIGSDDIQMSLNIQTTTDNSETNDLKTKFSLLSERLYESSKITTLSAPELNKYLDSRLEIQVSPGNIFHTFGITHVVYDKSDISNVPRNPGSWNITVSFTQANFTLDQYHTVEHTKNSYEIEVELSKLLARTRITADNKFEVAKFEVKNNKDFVSLTSYDQVTDLDTIVRLSFLTSSYGNNVANYISGIERDRAIKDYKLNSIKNILQKDKKDFETKLLGEESIIKQKDDISQIVNGVFKIGVDDRATEELNNLADKNKAFKSIIRQVVIHFNNSMDIQSKNLIASIGINTDALEKVVSTVKSSANTFAGSSKNKTLTGISGLFINALNGTVVGKSAKFFYDVVGGTLGDIVREPFEELQNKFSIFLNNLIDNYKRAVLSDLAHAIMRDPVLRDRFISKNLLGESTVRFIENQVKSNFVNCYKDFDVPQLYTPTSKKEQDFLKDSIRLAPDFFMYNDIDSFRETYEYVENSTIRLASIGKIAAMTSLFEAKETYERFENIIQKLPSTNNDKILPIIKTEINWKGSLDSSLALLRGLYSDLVLGDTTPSDPSKGSDGIKLRQANVQNLLTEAEKLRPDLTGAALEDYKIQISKFLEPNKLIKYSNVDKRKINLVFTARAKVLIELYEMYSVISDFMTNSIGSDSESKFKNSMTNQNMSIGKTNDKNKSILIKLGSKAGIDYNSVTDLHNSIKLLLENAQTITSKDSNNIKLQSIMQKYGTGGTAEKNSGFLQLPEIKQLQNEVYNKIGYYIRLNEAITIYNKNGGTGDVDLSLLPELKFLDWWNFRAVEDSIRQTDALRQIMDNRRDLNNTIKLFPTFKIYFIEEDKGIFNDLDDYYSFNAIQSIEITTNKSRASKVARVVLSNITGALTDQLSFAREKSDWLQEEHPDESDNVFFGTLDVKPGTSIMIKMGYASNDADLPVLFIGRILEMNPGPVCEIISQSYSAQLNHEVMAEKFGMWGDVKAHGDVASAILDLIPGLEKMGKKSYIMSPTQSQNGTGFQNYRGNIGDRFMLTNLLGNVTAGVFGQSNPRDENIYLPFDLVNTKLHKPTFDWVLYEQTVWEALQELALYHQGTSPIIRLYNIDSLSTKKDVRETLVIGNKSGYYKYTDSFSLSMQDRKEIDKLIKTWQEEIKSLMSTSDTPFIISRSENYDSDVNMINHNIKTDVYYKLNSKFVEMFKFFSDSRAGLIISTHIINHTDVSSNKNIFSFLEQAFEKISSGKIGGIVSTILNFNTIVKTGSNDLSNKEWLDTDREFTEFSKLLKTLRLVFNAGKTPLALIPEELYNVEPLLSNTSSEYSNDARYKKIQQQHLITDVDDIISNNIMLSNAFGNAVNLYYYKEPKFVTEDGFGLKDKDKVNIWSIKAFGDIKDEHLRPINSFQKNVDTNWYDIKTKTTRFFEDKAKQYQKIRIPGNKIEKSTLTELGVSENINLNAPNWEIFPSFVVVAINLLKKEVSKMYQGTIELVGNPHINPLDILHIQDYTNDMHGAVEVEEVTHIFTPDRGFRTVITPNLITYDRDPVQLQDLSIVNSIYEKAKLRRRNSLITGGVGLGLLTAGTIIGTIAGSPVTGGAIGLAGAGLAFNGFTGAVNGYHRFLYSMMGNIIGRDCLNFSALIHRGAPYMSGFDGIDYTSLATLINHKVSGIKDPIARYAAFTDPFLAMVSTDFNPEDITLTGAAVNKALPGLRDWMGYTDSKKLNMGPLTWGQ